MPANEKAHLMVHIYSNDRLLEKFYQHLEEPQDRDRLYVYRLEGNRKTKPAVFIGRPFGNLEPWLQTEHGGGTFHVMIRRGETMLVSGSIAIAPLPVRRQAS